MKIKNDHPGVYPPPPLFYVVTFFISIYLQNKFPFPNHFFETSGAFILATLFSALGLIIILPALIKFFKTKNTLITIKPANSLQTSGIYSMSRNPMYLGLLAIYISLAFYIGNFWTLILIPFIILIITFFVIRNEEEYLQRTFGGDFSTYCKNVRRWI